MSETESTEQEELLDEIIENGKCVHDLGWDSGAPSAGADNERIYKYHGQYYGVTSNWDVYGPYATLRDVLHYEEFVWINSATEYIRNGELTVDELLPYPVTSAEDVENVHRFTINGEPWLLTAGGQLHPDRQE